MSVYVCICVLTVKGTLTYRSQFANIPAKIFGNSHHLINNRIHFGGIQDTIAIGIVQSKHNYMKKGR